LPALTQCVCSSRLLPHCCCVQTGVTTPSLRDELLLQVMKQLRVAGELSPTAVDGWRRAHALLAVLLSSFPPSAVFADFVHAFVQRACLPKLVFVLQATNVVWRDCEVAVAAGASLPLPAVADVEAVFASAMAQMESYPQPGVDRGAAGVTVGAVAAHDWTVLMQCSSAFTPRVLFPTTGRYVTVPCALDMCVLPMTSGGDEEKSSSSSPSFGRGRFTSLQSPQSRAGARVGDSSSPLSLQRSAFVGAGATPASRASPSATPLSLRPPFTPSPGMAASRDAAHTGAASSLLRERPGAGAVAGVKGDGAVRGSPSDVMPLSRVHPQLYKDIGSRVAVVHTPPSSSAPDSKATPTPRADSPARHRTPVVQEPPQPQTSVGAVLAEWRARGFAI
jgi:hypothetical protein